MNNNFVIFNYLCPETQRLCYQNENYRDQWHSSYEGALFLYPEIFKIFKNLKKIKYSPTFYNES